MDTTPTISIGAFQSQDVAGVLAVLAEAMPTDAISEQRFTRQVLLDPNFRSEGAVVAKLGDQVVGFCLAIARQVPLENAVPDSDRGYVTLLVVGSRFRRQGVGTQLLAKAEEFLRALGRQIVMVSSYAPNYFIPGVDVKCYEGALALFGKRGYAEVYRPLAMQTDLWLMTTPEWVREKERGLSKEGIEVVDFNSGIAVPLLEFARQEFPGDWVRVVRETSARILQGDSPTRLMAAIDTSTESVVAFSHFENERFGPIGVAASQRGRCLGQVLMYRTLEAQRQAGFRAAWFLWSDDKTAARIYSAAGFKETRRFALLRKELA
jgi:mycothiol synthase